VQNPRRFDNECDIEAVEVTPGERGIRVAEHVAQETEHSHVYLAHFCLEVLYRLEPSHCPQFFERGVERPKAMGYLA